MGRVFAVRPKRIKRTNGQVLTPEMEITVTTKSYTCDPFIMERKRYKSSTCVCISSTIRRVVAAKQILSLSN